MRMDGKEEKGKGRRKRGMERVRVEGSIMENCQIKVNNYEREILRIKD